jgi:hypothetical protein
MLGSILPSVEPDHVLGQQFIDFLIGAIGKLACPAQLEGKALHDTKKEDQKDQKQQKDKQPDQVKQLFSVISMTLLISV